MNINVELIAIVGLPFYVMLLFIQDKITRMIYDYDKSIWERSGSPGGWFWVPHNYAFFDSLNKTATFWFNNMFGLENEVIFPEKIRRLYRIHYFIVIITLLAFIASVFILIYLKLRS